MKMKMVTIAAAVVFALAAVAQAPKPAPAAASGPAVPTEQTVNEFLRHMFGYDPALKWQVAKIDVSPEGMPEVFALIQNGTQSQTVHFYIAPDGKHAILGETLPFAADPFADARAVLGKVDGPSRGPANAPVTIVEFGDLQCPSCKQAQPIVDKLIADNPDARFVFANFPLTMHPWAFKAASYADCIARANPEAFWKFMHSTYDAQEGITPETADTKLTELAAGSGADGAKTAACAVAPETKARVDASIKLGLQAGVTGTPTLFFNGRKVGNVTGTPYDFLNRLAKFNLEVK
jgi:protein-disulfide isomerase